MIKKLLIANRGEIACRIIRTARKMGIETVAVYSDIDKGSKHVELADKAFHIGPSPSSQSYLNANKILDVAAKSGAEAIHPGFGFLSENADFADLINKNGKIFVGPPGSAIRSMGSKSESKKIMTAAGVPVVGGYFGENQDSKFLLEEAKKIGFPVLIKAVSGGGGKGMKIVREESEFLGQLESAKREALKSFKDDRVLVEKYISRSRHIEIQVFGDQLKNYVYLFERDCSVQRRHQKVIEEAPSTISQDLRSNIGKSAIDAARAVGYYNAGTVEFIFDVETNKYYFMEMNTRLQVEHPITEMITGQDLVEWQLLVASGKPLPKKQEELSINGHSIETRIYSEDPYNNFLPGNGKIHYMRLPKEDRDLRLEMGVRENDEISIFYDPMIAKLIVWGKNRDMAVQKMIGGLKDFKIGGLVNNVNFLRKCFEHEEFKSSHYDTRFIGQNQDQLLHRVTQFDNDSLVGAVLLRVCRNMESDIPHSFRNFRVTQPYSTTLSFKAKLTQSTAEPVSYTATITGNEESGFNVSITGPQGKVDANGITLNQIKEHYVSFSANKNIIEKEIWVKENKLSVFEDNSEILEITFDETKIGTAKSLGGQDKNSVKAPMPGTVVKVLVKEGDAVKAGAPVLIMEAMKMEHTIKAPKDIVVKKVNYKEGQFVDLGQTIIAFD